MFFKFFLAVSNWIVRNGWTPANQLFDQNELSALEECTKGDTKSAQLFQIISNEQKVHDLVGRPIVHLSGLKHATGEAEYTDDIRPGHGELFGSLVLSTIARGTILSIDPTEALALPGVVHFFDSNSIPPERNVQGVVASDEEIFASKEVKFKILFKQLKFIFFAFLNIDNM
jgi:xanthine dehydrogenase molybdopterin-binding subunit B